MLQAIESATAAPVIALSLMQRFRSRKEETFADKVLAEGIDPKPVSGRQELLENEINRAIWSDGWKAVTLHAKRMPWDVNVVLPFEQDEWELYHVAEDFSESTDVADEHPEKLEELKALFDEKGLGKTEVKRWTWGGIWARRCPRIGRPAVFLPAIYRFPGWSGKKNDGHRNCCAETHDAAWQAPPKPFAAADDLTSGRKGVGLFCPLPAAICEAA